MSKGIPKSNKSEILKKVIIAILPGLIVAGLVFSANFYYNLDLPKIIVQETQKIIGQLESTATTTLATLSGNVGIGTTTIGSRLTVQSSGTGTTTSALNIQNSAGTSLVFVRDDGNVGIGTTTPAYKLDVFGDLRVNTSSTLATTTITGLTVSGATTLNTAWTGILRADSGVVSTTTGSGGGVATSSPFSAGYIPYATSSLAITNSVIFQLNDNIGIGTTTPTQKLTVAGNIAPSADSTYDLGTSTAYWANTYTDKIYLNSTAYLDGATAGLVNLTGALTVSGTSTLATTTITKLAVSGATTLNTAWTGVLRADSGVISTTTGGAGVSTTTPFSAGYIPYATSSNSITNSVIFQLNGNVGIGTTSPSTLLQVYGTTTIMNGYVGIGTTAPSQLLSVKGGSILLENDGSDTPGAGGLKFTNLGGVSEGEWVLRPTVWSTTTNLFSDGFESGDLTKWSANDNDNGDLSASTTAKLHGNYGLSALIDDTTSISVYDNTPTAEKRYRCRFYIDPHTLTMANGQGFGILAGNSAAGTRLYLKLIYTDGYTIQVLDKTDANDWSKETSAYAISDAPHCIEVDWKASTGANNGTIELLIDGVSKQTVTGIDSDTEQIDQVQLGTFNISASSTSGTFYLDDFASNNDGSLIGPVGYDLALDRLGDGSIYSPVMYFQRSTGNVGIGTTTPSTLLQVYGTTTAQTILPQTTNTYTLGSATYKWANIYAATATIGSTITINTNTISGSTSTTFNTTAGNIILSPASYVGIGTSSPASLLSVYGTSTFMGGNVGIGTTEPDAKLTVKGTTASDLPTYSDEFLLATGWTSTGWTGSFASGWTHTIENTTVLSQSKAAVDDTQYQIAYTVTGWTAGSFYITFGGQSSDDISETGALGPTTISTANLTITPTTDFDGKIVISIKEITDVSTPVSTYQSSDGTVRTEIRANTGINNTFIGNGAGAYNTTGYYNSAMGVGALGFNTTGYNNTAMGTWSLSENTTGYSNSAVGVDALGSNTTGWFNTAMGKAALLTNTTGNYNTAIGRDALQQNATGSGNTALGYASLKWNTGDANSAMGDSALRANTTGFGNIAMGVNALLSNTTGDYNSAMGYESLSSNSTGTDNTAVGVSALYNTTGSYNTAIGNGAGDNLTTGSSNILLGYDIDTPATTTSSFLSIGNLIFATGGFGTGTTIGTGNVGIGTTEPEAKLHVASDDVSGDVSALMVENSHAAGSMTIASEGFKAGGVIYGEISGGNGIVGWGYVNGLTIKTGVATQDIGFAVGTNSSGLLPSMIIKSSGYVGIGTTEPGTKLEVSGTSTAIRITNTTAGYNDWELRSVIGAGVDSGFSLYDVSNALTRFVINDNGYVGIGTTAPTAALTFAAGSTINSLGALTINSSTTNALTLDSGTTGAINIGTNANAKTITIGNGTGATSLVLNAGTGAINIGANAVARTINIGTGAAVVQTINVGGTGINVIKIGSTQTAGSIALGPLMTGGTITIGGTGLQTGAIGIGTGTGAQQINLGSGTGVKTIKVGGTGANVITIGNTQNAGSIAMGAAMTGGTITIGGTAAQTGTLTFGFSTATNIVNVGIGTGTTTLNLATGVTNPKTINIGTGAIGNTITIGNTTGATALNLKTGTGNILTAGGNFILGPASASAAASFQLREGSTNGTEFIGFKAPDAVTTSVTFTLPSADGTVNQILQTNGSAVLSWSANSASGMANPMTTTGDIIYGSTTATPANPARLAIGTAGQCLVVTGGIPAWGACSNTSTAAGADTQVQYNNLGSFGASSNFIWNNTNKTLSVTGTSTGAKVSLALLNGSTGSGASNELRIGNSAAADTLTLSVNSNEFTGAGNYAYIYNRQNAPLIFGTNNTARMTISATGDVGIGTTSPASYLDGNTGLSIYNASYPGMSLANESGHYLMSMEGTDLRFYNGDIRVTFQGGGNVGIGTMSPVGKLTILGTSGVADEIVFSMREGGDMTYGWDYTLDDAADGDLMLNRVEASSSANVMTFARTSGNVGIGTTGPGAKLSVSETMESTFIELVPTDETSTGTYGEIKFWGDKDRTSGRYAAIRGVNTGGTDQNELAFLIGFGGSVSEVLRIDDQGALIVKPRGDDGNHFRVLQADGQGAFSAGTWVGGDGFARIYDASENVDILLTSSGDSYFNGGYVGIGTTTPNNLLSVYQLIDFNNTDANTKLGYQAGKNIVSGAQYNTFVGYQAGMASSTGSTNAALYNTAVGTYSLYSNATGYGNSAMGVQALYSNTIGGHNSAMGINTLQYNTIGGANSAMGAEALRFNTEGSYNTAMGDNAGYSNTTGNYNSFMGQAAGYSNTTGYDNSFMGLAAGYSNTEGYANSFMGRDAGYSNTDGNENTAIGYRSLYSNTTGGANSAMGYAALRSNTTGNFNTAMGWYALYSSATSSENTAMGRQALYSNTTGSENTAMGHQALYLNTTGGYNTAMGYGSLRSNTTGAQNTAIGNESLYSNTTGNQNTAIGYYSLNSNTTGTQNTAMGYASLNANATGAQNTAMGNDSLRSNTTGNFNTAIGNQSLYSNTTASNNSAMGYASLYSNATGTKNTAMGYASLNSNTTGSYNTAMGYDSLRSNTTGTYNSAMGLEALYANTTGILNSAIGKSALYSSITGDQNSAMGMDAGRYQADGSALTNPQNSVYLGSGTRGFNNSDNNSIVIGYNAIGIGANTVVLGNNSIVTTALKGNVGIGTTTVASKLTIQGTSTTPLLNVMTSSTASALYISNTGYVGIGTTTPGAYKLYVNAGSSASAGIGVNGYIKATGSITGTTTLDLAERFPIGLQCQDNNNCPEAGDVVVVEKDNEGQSFHIEKSTESYDKKLIGVVSTNPGFILGGGLDENNSRLVALAGRVPVKVSTENGPIEIGDYLTSASSTPGVAMAACAKASASQESTCKAGRVIGMALEPFDGAQGEIGKIMVLINPHWQGNDLAVQENASGQIVNLDVEQLRSGLASLGLIVNENGVLEVDTLKTRQLCVGSVCVTEEEFKAVFGAGSGGSGGSGSSDGEPEPVCSADRLDLCTTQELCEGASLYWYDDTCHLGPKTETCAPNWQCSDWQPQIDESLCGQTIGQTRTCTDTNGCGGEEGKPSESQEIEAPECPEPEPEPEP